MLTVRLGDMLNLEFDDFFHGWGITVRQFNVLRILYVRDPERKGLSPRLHRDAANRSSEKIMRHRKIGRKTMHAVINHLPIKPDTDWAALATKIDAYNALVDHPDFRGIGTNGTSTSPPWRPRSTRRRG